jgi:hypothetical protein
MLRRYVSASAVASMATAFAAICVYFMPKALRPGIFALLLVWLCLPVVWGVWAMLAPRSWTPQRLPSWGAALGVIAGIGAYFVLNVSARFGMTVSAPYRAVGVLGVVVVYYVLWTIVRTVFVSLSKPEAEASPRSGAAHAA